MTQLTCFKAYDIRGELGEELNEDIAYRIGRAYGEFLKPGKIVVGGDVRLTSESLKLALARGLMDAGTDVLDIGLSGTEEIYFATFHLGVDGGIEVTASHNPMNYNGMKLVRENAKPISGDTGLRDIQRPAEENQFPPVDPARRGTLSKISVLKEYVDHLMSYVDFSNFTRPLKLVVNSGNGAAGHVIDEVEKRFAAAGVPVTFIKVHHQPDGHFPNGIPNPLLPECRRIPPTRCASIRPTWGLPLTATSIAASCSMTKLRLSRGTTLSACWRKRSCRSSRGRKSFTTRV
ncbi:hypothetical protein ECZU27_49710 [Escherichia coli]|nr:hypothetical protein ECZU27_49710 [Escherichia coli]